MAKKGIVAGLVARGFDKSHAIPFEKGARIGCSQCQAVCVNGVPCHETGCPNAKVQLPPPPKGPADIITENHGSIVLFRPENEVGRNWLVEHTDGTWWGGALAVEHRFAFGLSDGATGDGLVVR